MNKYIKIAKTPTSVGIGGTFSALASFKLDNINFYFNNVNVKIDTGCSISTIVKNIEHFRHWVSAYPFYRNVQKEGVALYETA